MDNRAHTHVYIKRRGLPPSIWTIALALAFWKRRRFLRRRLWNRWIAALLASTVIWGILAYFSGSKGILEEVTLGGWIGQRVKGSSDVLGVLRVTGLTALVAALAAPHRTGRLLKLAIPLAGRTARAPT